MYTYKYLYLYWVLRKWGRVAEDGGLPWGVLGERGAICIYIYIYIIHMYTHICVCVCVCIYVCVCVYIYIYINH